MATVLVQIRIHVSLCIPAESARVRAACARILKMCARVPGSNRITRRQMLRQSVAQNVPTLLGKSRENLHTRREYLTQ